MPAVAAATPPPYTGTFDRSHAGHLLRRTLFGPTLREIDRAVEVGMEATINRLFSKTAPPAPPLNHFFRGDWNVPVGQTWVDQPFIPGVNLHQYREPSLRAWYWQSLMERGVSIEEKMTLFWINHFGVDDSSEQRAHYDFIRLLRKRATGNFRQLIKEVTVHPAMLHFLDGRTSYLDNPNENFARELIELFSVQKGKPGSPTYTEKDVQEIARIMTGWRVRRFWGTEQGSVESYFQADWHDSGTKQLSHHFGNAVITNRGDREYAHLIDIIFRHPHTARSICRDLYRYFAHYEITDRTERELIEPLAQLLVASNYELKPVIKALLASRHFYSPDVRGAMVKNPYEFLLSMVRPVGGYRHLNLGLRAHYDLMVEHHKRGKLLSMDFVNPPSVSGWRAYYHAPRYHRHWITTVTLLLRAEMSDELCRRGYWSQGKDRLLDLLGFLATLTDPYDVNAVIDDISTIFLPRPITRAQQDSLKKRLLNGLPDFEWTVEYRLYRSNPDDKQVRDSMLERVCLLLRTVFQMAEFHLQ